MSDNKTKYWVKASNGIFQEEFLDWANRGMFFGDGLFETMVFHQGAILFRDAHQERLLEGLSILKISSQHLSDIQDLESFLLQSCGTESTLRVRWNVYRKGLGKYTPDSPHCDETVWTEAFLPAPAIKATAYIHPRIRLASSSWSHCKTLNALPYVLANLDRREKGFDEVLLLDDKGRLSEAGSSNLFWKIGESFFTPSLDCNGIAGVSRRTIIEHLQKLKMDLTEGEFQPSVLQDADQVFTSNVSGVSYIGQLEGQEFDTQAIESIASLFVAQ
ncbi:aminotransferase class IV [Pararhodonellum marinum]|uniref:aminotransferase class IV n=1 Tax=Pararhodonellum marinum TaxID=2755358 RepID=UPI00188F0A3A|nr:aminotransferase class IV [Pararhodonellum marinum]